MARYTGPKDKISRRFGVPLFGTTKALEQKNYPPGMHGPKGSRRKQSEYALALAEKQKLRYQYGVLERQFRRYFQTALTRRGVTGQILLQLLETRLDNVVFRLGFASSRSAARQMVSHGHVQVNGPEGSMSLPTTSALGTRSPSRTSRTRAVSLRETSSSPKSHLCPTGSP
jgi:small subunit ribosomal protein S4